MGKQIRIYLADGSATGIRHGEIANWTGQALACPRSRFAELREWAELRRPGVYLLFGLVEETGEDAVYIGESEVVLDRLANHVSGKEFWTDVVAFTSKDDFLTKAHIRYLESKLVLLSASAQRFRVMNDVAPQLPSLPRGDRDAMEEFLANLRILLGVLGHRPLDPYTMRSGPVSSDAVTVHETQQGSSVSSVTDVENLMVHLSVSGCSATAVKTDEGLVVLAGAKAALHPKESLTGGYRLLRERLLAAGLLVSDGNVLRLQADQLFTSPSQAAAVLVGYSINGRDAWKLPDGTTLGQLDQRTAQQLLRELDSL